MVQPLVDEANDETQILSVPVRLRQSGREIRMLIDKADPFSSAKPDVRLIKLLIRAHRFNATLVGSGGTPFAALAKLEGVSPSYFTRLVRLSYLAPDITQAILDGRQPSYLTADKLLGALTSTIGLARSTDPARLWLSRSEPKAPPRSPTLEVTDLVCCQRRGYRQPGPAALRYWNIARQRH
jgi:hypothetical protein